MGKKQTVSEKPLIIEDSLQDVIIQSLIEKKGENIISINLKTINHVFFDSFIICTGNSKPHVDTLSDYIRENAYKTLKTKPTFVEGVQNSEWILLDYFNIIVHIFQPEARAFYNIEQLWGDAEIQHF